MSAYSRMIVIPQEEYTQMSAMQQVRQPLADQVYRSERDYQQNLHIKDPHRAVLLQSETIERLKDLKDQMRHYLTISTPKPYRTRAEALFQSIEPYLNVNEKGEVIKDDNSVIESSRYEDLIQHAVRDRRRSFVPTGWDYFIKLLKNHNVPKSSLNRETLDELDAPKLTPPRRSMLPIPTKRTPSSFHTPMQTPTKWMKTSPQSSTQRKSRSRSRRPRAPPKKFMFSHYLYE